MIADLAQIRADIIAGRCPVLLDLADVATALDVSRKTAEARFDNMVMAAGTRGDRCLIRAAEVREILIANRPKEAPAPARECLSCGAPLEPGQRRFCSPQCSRATPTARLRLRAERASANPSVSAVISAVDFCAPATSQGSAPQRPIGHPDMPAQPETVFA